MTVFVPLAENGLSHFYELAAAAGVRVKATRQNRFQYLDEAGVRERIVNFQDERITRVTFRIPAIHCVACVWLLENLFRLRAGIGESRVDFSRKGVAVSFENGRVKLSEVVGLLASLGYEPELRLSDLSTPRCRTVSRRLWLQLAVAGFAFGNLMLLAIGPRCRCVQRAKVPQPCRGVWAAAVAPGHHAQRARGSSFRKSKRKQSP